MKSSNIGLKTSIPDMFRGSRFSGCDVKDFTALLYNSACHCLAVKLLLTSKGKVQNIRELKQKF